MDEHVDYFSYTRNQKLIFLSVIISGLVGFAVYGFPGSVYGVVGTLCIELIFWAWNG